MHDPVFLSSRLTRRFVLAGAGSLLLPTSAWASSDFQLFLDEVRREARAAGISEAAIASALAIARPNAHVLALNDHQPEFTLTWTQYETRVLPRSRLDEATRFSAQRAALLTQVRDQFSVDPGVIVGIWGLESDFGRKQGDYDVFESLATLAYGSRRHRFFRDELIGALKITDHRGIATELMRGSWAGAMGQPQFMPSAYLRFARSLNGGNRADIWNSQDDVASSIGNYIGQSGWRLGEPWGQKVLVPASLAASFGPGGERSLGEWQSLGVRRIDGGPFSRHDVVGRLLLPGGDAANAFIVYRNFDVIRRYNPSDFYALAVGLLGNQASV